MATEKKPVPSIEQVPGLKETELEIAVLEHQAYVVQEKEAKARVEEAKQKIQSILQSFGQESVRLTGLGLRPAIQPNEPREYLSEEKLLKAGVPCECGRRPLITSGVILACKTKGKVEKPYSVRVWETEKE